MRRITYELRGDILIFDVGRARGKAVVLEEVFRDDELKVAIDLVFNEEDGKLVEIWIYNASKYLSSSRN